MKLRIILAAAVLAAGSIVARGASYYVNDGSTANDAWCSAAGNDANSGTSANAPKATVQDVLADYDLEAGDTIHMDTGRYVLTNDITVGSLDGGVSNLPVTIRGSAGGTVIDGGSTNGGYGVVLNGVTGVELRDLTITNAYEGVEIKGDFYTGSSRNNSLSNLTIRSVRGSGVRIENSSNTRMDFLDLSGGSTGIRIYHSTGNRVANSAIRHHGGDGIYAEYFSLDNSVMNCTIAFNGGKQVAMKDCQSLISVSNSILVASGPGSACICRYYDSLELCNPHGCWYLSGYGLYRGDHNNLYAFNGADVGQDEGSVHFPTLADWQAHLTQDVHSCSANPLFVDGAGGDLHLRSAAASGTYVQAIGGWTSFPGENSPCIDAGNPAAASANEPAWNGGRLNQGAYGNTPFASRSLEGPAHVFYVNDDSMSGDAWCSAAGDDSNPGYTPNRPKATLKAVLDTYDLGSGDVVRVDSGTYLFPTIVTVAVEDAGTSGGLVSILGNPGRTILAGPTGFAGRAFVILATNLALSGLTFTNCGVEVSATEIYSSVWINDTVIRNAPGEGLRMWWYATVVATNLKIIAAAADGAALYGRANLTDCEIRGCGGAAVTTIRYWPVVLDRCLIWSNKAGGVFFYTDGYSPGKGWLNNCTIAYNGTSQLRCVRSGFPTYNSGVAYLTNCIFAAHGAGNRCILDEGGLMVGAYNNFHASGGATTNDYLPGDPVIVADPQFVDPSAGDFHLKSAVGRWSPAGSWVTDAVHSACIDAGDPAAAWANETAPNGGRVNLGCYGNTPQASRSIEAPAHVYYVNDGSTVGDAWCSAAGSDANAGYTPSAPKATLPSLLAAHNIGPGDRIYVDTGVYALTNSWTMTTNESGTAASRVCLIASTGRVVMAFTNSRIALYLDRTEYVDVSGFTISNAHTGVDLENAWDCGVRDVAVRGAVVGIKLMYGGYHQIKGVDLRDGQDGFMIYESVHNWIMNSVAWSNSGDGIHLMHGSAPTHVYCCTIGGNGYRQIDTAHSNTRLELWNSIVAANGSGNACIWQYDDGGGPAQYAGDYNVFHAVNGASVGGYWRNPSSTYYASLASWQAFSTQDVHSLGADPLFASSAGDLHLRSSAADGTFVTAIDGWTNFPGQNSPGIDAGSPGDSCVNEPAWNGGIVNAGAYGNTPFASRSADSDGDWLSDSIEQYRYGSNPNSADSDGDGMGDRFELLAGTDATNSASLFEADGLVTPADAGNRFVLQWRSVAGRSYRIEWSTNILSRFTTLQINIPATPPLNSVTVTVTGVERELFRVGLE